MYSLQKYNFYKMNTKINNISITKLLLISALLFGATSFADGYGGIKTVVIDAGHGGKDPGCHGHKNTKEKDITLAIALKLGTFIETKYPDINLIYTRKTDVFVELDKRAQIANSNNADLFICIHANAGGDAAIGVETFVLGLHRTDAQRKIAERENSSIQLEEDGGDKYKDFDMSVDAIIARQLQLSVFLDHSIVFASKIQDEMVSLGRKNRGVKQAGFLVLYKTTMPSVLIETGFLTNYQEELFLQDTSNQTKMATSFFNAFEGYKEYYEKGIVSNVTEKAIDYGLSIDELNEDDVVFRVQIETNTNNLELSDITFKGVPVWMYKNNNLYKYTAGAYNNFDSANELKSKMREKGFEHAFVVAFHKNERINLEKAIKLAEN
jgi:N-acetylmuramoyl-L-alanine amidase